jgi:hypothetical protein
VAHDWVVAASSNNTLGGFWRPKSGFQRNVWIVSATFPSIVSRMWQTNLWFRFGVLFLLFSLLLNFYALLTKFSKQPFNLFLLEILFMFFWLLFVLFEIIYKINFFSISSSFNFLSVRFGPYYFDCYLFYLR